MRFPLGFSILLVLVLGLLCPGPISAHYFDGEDNQSAAAATATTTEGSTLVAVNQAASELVDEGQSQQQVVVVAENQPTAVEQLEPSPDPTSPVSAIDDDSLNQAEKPEKREKIGLPSTSRELSGSVQLSSDSGEQQQPPQQQEDQEENSSSNSNNDADQQQQQPRTQLSAGELMAPANLPKNGESLAKNDKSQTQVASSARGMGNIMSAMGLQPPNLANVNTNQGQQQQQPEQVQQQTLLESDQQQQPRAASITPPRDVPKENLPTIIENNKPVSAEQQLAQQQQQQLQATQQQLQQANTGLAVIGQQQSPANMSTARTFGDSWTNCVGASTGKYGTCKNDVECKKNKGVTDGSCMGGLGVCCVMALTCGDKSIENNTFYANPDFPEPSWEARLCEVEVKKKHKKILQVMIEFEEFELAPPNHDGECITDVFQVKLASSRPSPYSLLRVCGQNTGQHMYLDVSQIDEPLVLSVATSGGGFPRRWSIRIVQLDEKNYLLAPPGCLQYYTDTVGHFRSFNLGRNLKNLYYAICFRIDNGYSGIRFTSNFFGMNGPMCRRLGKPPPMIGGHGRHNSSHTIEAHPHHLVIPPPGYAPPPPKPKMIEGPPHQQQPYHHQQAQQHYQQPSYPQQQQPQYPQQQYPQQHQQHQQQPTYHPSVSPNYQQQAPGAQPIRFKRFAYSEPTGERVQRTFGSEHHHPEHHHKEHFKAHETDKKVFEHEHEHKHVHPHPAPPTYGPSYQPGYGPAPPSYGPPPPPMHYGQEYPPSHYEHGGKKEEFKDKWQHEKWDDKHSGAFKKHPHELEAEKSWWDPSKLGWKSAEKKDDKFLGWKAADKKDDKFGWKSDRDEAYGYGGNYGPPMHHGYSGGGYGPPPSYGPSYGGEYQQHPSHHHQQHHQHGGHSTYGPHYGGGSYGYAGGEYHHKEIDKFGKKYEHLEYKHEKNHLDKEGKKDESSWWWWGKKDDKKDKKEKYFSHHEALFPMMHIPEMPHCEPRFCGQNDVITFPPSGDSISEMCGNRFNRGHGPKIISGSPLVVYVSNRGHTRGAGFDMNYEQVFYVPRPY